MLNLNTSSRQVQSLCDAHYTAVVGRVTLILQNVVNQRNSIELHHRTRDSITSKKKSLLGKSQGVSRNLWRFAKYLLNPLNNDLEAILKCKPEDFTSLHSRLNSQFHFDEEVSSEKVMHPLLQIIFNYEHLCNGIDNYSAFKLVDNIGTNTCPYCNRQYITVVQKGEKRPPLDHFYPRSKYPIFGISFYNLIPSCYQCNSSFKSDKDTKTEEFLHPYREGFSKEARFRFVAGSIEKTELLISSSDPDRETRLNGSSERFEIEEVYKVHSDVAREIYDKSLRNSAGYAEHIEKITSQISQISSTKEEFYQFYFGNYHNEDDFEKRPLAKYTADLVDELQVMQLYNQK